MRSSPSPGHPRCPLDLCPIARRPVNILDKATQGSNPLAAAGQLGSSITDMEQHVTGLQKNLDTLKKIQSALTGK